MFGQYRTNNQWVSTLNLSRGTLPIGAGRINMANASVAVATVTRSIAISGGALTIMESVGQFDLSAAQVNQRGTGGSKVSAPDVARADHVQVTRDFLESAD